MSCAPRFCIFLSIVTSLFCSGWGGRVWSADEFDDVKTISRLPATAREVEAAHARSRADACEQIPAGEPETVHSFTPYLTPRDSVDVSRTPRERPRASSRHAAFTVGIEIDSRDRSALPALSRGQIVDYVDEHFVSIQVRIRRDLLDRELYFFHRPIALTFAYRGSRLSQKFEPLIADRIAEFHGLGIFVSKEEETRIRKPEQYRTMVMLFRDRMLTGAGRAAADSYEFALIRGREGAEEDELERHVFVTTQERKTLNYLQPAASPKRSRDCSILGRAVVTDFDGTGLYPTASATRSFRLQSRQSISASALDAFCDEKGLSGGFVENVNVVLDAIIDGLL